MRLHGEGAVCAFLRFRYVFHQKVRDCEDRERCAHLFFTAPRLIQSPTLRWSYKKLLFNYMFTEEGIELANYGVEGLTFEYEDGEPVYTDMILNNPDGFNSNVARSLYTLNAFLPYFQPQAALEMTFTSPRMGEAEAVWMATRSAEAYSWTLDSAEAEEYNALISGINTKIQEELTAMVMGQESMTEWDALIDTLYSMDMQRCIDLQQQAFDRKYA